MSSARFSLGLLVLIGLELALLVAAPGCAKGVRLTIPQLRELEACVIEAEDQVARQNCVERFIPSGDR